MGIEYSDDTYFCVDDGEVLNVYDCIDKVEESLWDEFDEEDWIEDNYSAIGLWREVVHRGEDAIRDEMRESCSDRARDEFNESACDSEFEAGGIIFRPMRTYTMKF